MDWTILDDKAYLMKGIWALHRLPFHWWHPYCCSYWPNSVRRKFLNTSGQSGAKTHLGSLQLVADAVVAVAVVDDGGEIGCTSSENKDLPSLFSLHRLPLVRKFQRKGRIPSPDFFFLLMKKKERKIWWRYDFIFSTKWDYKTTSYDLPSSTLTILSSTWSTLLATRITLDEEPIISALRPWLLPKAEPNWTTLPCWKRTRLENEKKNWSFGCLADRKKQLVRRKSTIFNNALMYQPACVIIVFRYPIGKLQNTPSVLTRAYRMASIFLFLFHDLFWK